MTLGQPIQSCPKCGGALQPTIDSNTGDRGVRCWRTTCLFNFLDQQCNRCGGPVASACRQDVGKYRVTCAHQHEWTC